MAAFMDSGRTRQPGKQLGAVSYHFPLLRALYFSWEAGQKRLQGVFLVLWLLHTEMD